jgi:hypothetical protein
VEGRHEANVPSVAFVVLVVAVGAMAVDHLLGTERNDDDGLVDPAMFGIGVGVSLAVTAVFFGWLVPRELRKGPERAARSGLACSVAGVVPGLALIWVGVPFVLAGAGLVLGLEGRGGTRRTEARAPIAIGALVLGLGALAYTAAAVR